MCKAVPSCKIHSPGSPAPACDEHQILQMTALPQPSLPICLSMFCSSTTRGPESPWLLTTVDSCYLSGVWVWGVGRVQRGQLLPASPQWSLGGMRSLPPQDVHTADFTPLQTRLSPASSMLTSRSSFGPRSDRRDSRAGHRPLSQWDRGAHGPT